MPDNNHINFEDCPVGIRVLQLLENVTAELRSSKEEIAKLNKRLFYNNGGKCLQTIVAESTGKVNAHDRILWGIGGGIGLILVTQLMMIILKFSGAGQ